MATSSMNNAQPFLMQPTRRHGVSFASFDTAPSGRMIFVGWFGPNVVREASHAEIMFEKMFVLSFLMGVAMFAARLYSLDKDRPLVHVRRSHELAVASVLTMAITHALVLARAPSCFPWQYVGRLVTSAFLVISFGYMNCKPIVHCSAGRQGWESESQVISFGHSDMSGPCALAACAWALLGAATVANTTPLYWILAFSGVLAGIVALHLVQDYGGLVDLALACNIIYFALFLARGREPIFESLLNGCIDFIYAVGINHLVTKHLRKGAIEYQARENGDSAPVFCGPATGPVAGM